MKKATRFDLLYMLSFDKYFHLEIDNGTIFPCSVALRLNEETIRISGASSQRTVSLSMSERRIGNGPIVEYLLFIFDFHQSHIAINIFCRASFRF